ncbi:hypothetical protein F5Y08DRAFT_101983 [Xylaria arbuscula]|nr:hypothetical protein F5Y08DRAFT_101983 [Xylaria arbuscula]
MQAATPLGLVGLLKSFSHSGHFALPNSPGWEKTNRGSITPTLTPPISLCLDLFCVECTHITSRANSFLFREDSPLSWPGHSHFSPSSQRSSHGKKMIDSAAVIKSPGNIVSVKLKSNCCTVIRTIYQRPAGMRSSDLPALQFLAPLPRMDS